MANFSIVITSIAGSENNILKNIGSHCKTNGIQLIIIGDKKSPDLVEIEGCNYYSLADQNKFGFELATSLPENSYCRKMLGYLEAIKQGDKIIVETDDDNIPLPNFWDERTLTKSGNAITQKGWINIYRFFSEKMIWPRGFPLQSLHDPLPVLENMKQSICPVQQGLADREPDVDAVFRMIFKEEVYFKKAAPIAIQFPAVCPFNSQNTTWFEPAFPLMYLPVTCSFRMTDIWRSFIAQRILVTCGWFTLFTQSTVEQIRNPHNLFSDFRDENEGYLNYAFVVDELSNLSLQKGQENIGTNLKVCYEKLIEMEIFKPNELTCLNHWLKDLESIKTKE